MRARGLWAACQLVQSNKRVKTFCEFSMYVRMYWNVAVTRLFVTNTTNSLIVYKYSEMLEAHEIAF